MLMWLLLIASIFAAISWFYLRGEDLRPYDQPRQPPFAARDKPSDGHQQVLKALGGTLNDMGGLSRKQRLHAMRKHMDSFGQDVVFDGEIIPVSSGTLKGEWLVAPGADTSRRFLYIHGGAWLMGSPLSHRAITARLAKVIGGAVFSLDYRLMPEHQRRDGIEDCRNAYRWMLKNGPEGAAPAELVYVGGDSAGGNLTLSLISWARDQGLRAPNAAIALSPATDSTLRSPTMRSNVGSDAMLGPQFGKLNKVPKWILWWGSWIGTRIAPADPIVSPAFGDLSRLPPVLVHASEAEMLLDDARRYINKARAHGSPVSLQTWTHMVHVWHFFERILPEADEAFIEIEGFLQREGALPKGSIT